MNFSISKIIFEMVRIVSAEKRFLPNLVLLNTLFPGRPKDEEEVSSAFGHAR